MKFKYEYECVSQENKVVAKGVFYREVYHNINHHDVKTAGYFGMMEHAHKELEPYHGIHHLKHVYMTITNPCTGSVRHIG